MAIFSSLFAVAVIISLSGASILTQAVYRAGTFIPNPTGGKPFNAFFRYELPFVGQILALSGVLLVGVAIAFLVYIYQNNEKAKQVGHLLLKAAFIAQIVAVGFWVTGIKSNPNVQAGLQAQLEKNPAHFVAVGKELASKENLSVQQMAAITPKQFEQAGRQFFQQNSGKMYLSLNTNPVEFAGLLTALAGTFFVILFAFRTETLRERLPSLETLDNLMYKTACLAFAGLAMLLITGAIWANESWGRPWGFDSKETGALVAWLTYAAFLHTRISRGWHGRSSAYFAILGFLLVIFTYLGVSYLLPGLHSYA
jgi:cytochrome c-type biogenesis protein CcsB